MKNEVVYALRISQEVKEMALKNANREDRSMASYIRQLIIQDNTKKEKEVFGN